MTQQQVLDILTRLSQQKPVTSQELTDLSREILNRSSHYLNNSLNGSQGGDDTPYFDINSLKEYTNELIKVQKVINGITANKASGYTYSESEQKQLDQQLKKQAELNKRIAERQELDYLIKKLSEGINEDYELQERALSKQIELQNLERKGLKEGLTYEERRHKWLTKIGEQIGINTNKFNTGLGDIKKGIGDVKSGILGVKSALDKFNDAWGRVDQASADFTKRIGGSKASMEALRKSTIDFMETRSIGIKYNTSMEELIKLQSDYNASIGRSIDLTNDQKETFAAMKSVVGDQAAMEFTTKLENFGLNPDEVGDRVGQMFSKAAKSGVAFEKYSKNFLDNIKLAQNYNFKNGLRGLESMAKKASEIKMDMQQVVRFADKVSTLEGAVQAGAQLSVLGGSFAQYGNPLQMMYEGLNDMEGLQDRMIGMFGKLGKWDYTKGQVDVSVFNKQRIKAAAEATGMDYSALMEQINASARRNIVEGKLGAQYNNDKEFKELLLNKAQLDENGNAYVTVNGERKDVNKLTAQDKDYLKASNNSDSDNIAEIAVNTRGFKDISEGFDKQKDVGAAQVNEITGIGNYTKSIMGKMGENTTIMRTLGVIGPITEAIKGINQAILGVVTTIAGAVTIGRAFGGGGGGFPGKNIQGNMPRGGNFGNMGNAGNIFKNFGGSSAGLRAASKFGNSGFGRFATFGGSKTAIGRSAIGNIAKAGGYGKYLMKGAGIGAVAGIAGAVGDHFIDKSSLGRDKGHHVGGYTAAKVGTGALKGAGIGATIGSIIPGIGTGIGAAIGAGVGAIWGGVAANIEAKKEAKANILRTRFGANINNASAYSMEELERMQFGTALLPAKLYQKMKEHGDNLGGYKDGGLVTQATADAHHGEVVIPEAEVKKSDNLMKPLTVSAGPVQDVRAEESRVEIQPIKIDLTGDLKIGGEKVNAEKVLESITPQLIDRINDGLENRRNFRIDRNKTHMKYRSM